jgi:hypothetical protein
MTLLLTSTAAMAHFKIGTYSGLDTNGVDCTIEFKKKTFVNNVKNPINERVFVVVNGNRPFIVTHLPLVDTNKMSVVANKSNLTGVKGGNMKAVALQIDMDHTVGGPANYSIIKHDWANKKRSKFLCEGLEFQNK